jgi:hypothetical protein
MKSKVISDLTQFYRIIGKMGGKRKSAKKRAAGQRNAAKARAARWPTKKKGGAR